VPHRRRNLERPRSPAGRHVVITFGELQAVVAAFLSQGVDGVSGSQAAAEAVGIAELVNRLDAGRLARLAIVQAEGTWALDGSRSTAAWLAPAERSSKGADGSDLKTARLLSQHLPATHAAVLAGDLPVEHARVLSRTCLRTPAMREMLGHPTKGEDFLLSQAHLGLDDYRRFLNAWAQRADPEAVDAAYKEGRDDHWLQVARTTDGVAVRGFLDPVTGEGFVTMLEAQAGAPEAGDTRDRPARLHDALSAIVQRVLDGGGLGVHNAVRPQVVVHVPWVTFKAEADAAGVPAAWLQESGTPIPRRVLERIACDGELSRVVFGPDGQVLDLDRASRLFTRHQRRALDARDGGCRWPGCHAPPEVCEAHHRIWWRRGGPTEVREGLVACHHHHGYVHDHEVRIEHGVGGSLEFYDRSGLLIGVSHPDAGPDPDPLPWPAAV
jgi:Domain of unknown function (DUF222)